MNQIELSAVHKTYATGANTIIALEGASLTLEPANSPWYSPSGSGKTTLLNILGDWNHLTAAKCWPRGRTSPILQPPAHGLPRHKVGFIFQYFNLLPTLTALENVSLAAEMNGGASHDPASILARVGLGIV